MKKNYIIFTDCGISEDLCVKYGGDFFFKKGMRVYYLDLSYILKRDVVRRYGQSSNFCLVEVKNIVDIVKAMWMLPCAVVNINISRLGFVQLIILFVLKIKKSILFSEVISDNLEAVSVATRFSSNASKNKNQLIEKILSILKRVWLKLIAVSFKVFCRLDFLLAKSDGQAQLYPLYYDGLSILHGRDWDLESVLDAQCSPINVLPDTAIIVDQYIPFHPEIIDSNLQDFFANYYKNLLDFIKYWEANSRIKFMVLPHPQANLNVLESIFPGKCITKKRMLSILNRISFFCGHFSMGLNYAVASMKPIVFLTSPEFSRAGLEKSIQAMAFALCQPVFNMNDRNYSLSNLAVNKDAYLKYLDLSSLSVSRNQLSNWELVFCSAPVTHYVNSQVEV